ncbi:mediator of RNA polymerase II transcription subunit 23 [Tanacetum coccineum]
MVDVLLHNIQLELQHGHSLQCHDGSISLDVISNSYENLANFIWIHELLPPDILLLALTDRDDDPHSLCIMRMKLYVSNRGNPKHWLQNGACKRIDLQKALGNHLSWKERYPTCFDDIAARLLRIIPLIIYRIIENDAIDPTDRAATDVDDNSDVVLFGEDTDEEKKAAT